MLGDNDLIMVLFGDTEIGQLGLNNLPKNMHGIVVGRSNNFLYGFSFVSSFRTATTAGSSFIFKNFDML